MRSTVPPWRKYAEEEKVGFLSDEKRPEQWMSRIERNKVSRKKKAASAIFPWCFSVEVGQQEAMTHAMAEIHLAKVPRKDCLNSSRSILLTR